MTYQETPPYQPQGKAQAIAIMTLISGILNVLLGIGLTGGFVLGTWGLGLLCAPVTILPSVLGIFEIIGAAKLMGNPPRKFNVQTIAILEIALIITGSFISLIIGILNLVFYNEPATKHYIDSLPS